MRPLDQAAAAAEQEEAARLAELRQLWDLAGESDTIARAFLDAHEAYQRARERTRQARSLVCWETGLYGGTYDAFDRYETPA